MPQGYPRLPLASAVNWSRRPGRRDLRSPAKRTRLRSACGALCLALVVLAGCSGASRENSGGEASPHASSAGTQRVAEEGVMEVEGMSVRSLVGQMFMISVGSTEPDYYVEKMIRERNIGGVLLFGYNME